VRQFDPWTGTSIKALRALFRVLLQFGVWHTRDTGFIPSRLRANDQIATMTAQFHVDKATTELSFRIGSLTLRQYVRAVKVVRVVSANQDFGIANLGTADACFRCPLSSTRLDTLRSVPNLQARTTTLVPSSSATALRLWRPQSSISASCRPDPPLVCQTDAVSVRCMVSDELNKLPSLSSVQHRNSTWIKRDYGEQQVRRP